MAARSSRTRRPVNYWYHALGVASVIGGLGLWWLASVLNPTTLPGPVDVAARAGELFLDGTLQEHLLASLQRVLLGFVIGSGLAIPLGFLMGWYKPFRAILEPWTQFFRTIPPLALIPLMIVLLGIGEVPKVAVISLAAFLVSIVATFQGVLNVDKTLINAGRVLGASDLVIFRSIVIPASTPFIMVGLRQGLGSAWATVVAAELIAAQLGLGFMMQRAQIYYDLPTIFVGVVIIGLLGLVMDRVLLWADSVLTSWQERR
ncbi:ABC transporter permease [Tessaracoccus rhinocerotis]|uniref:ABC transporter permease n=1 Tax=Tessaracoccus rhinocerotis TaxID=1689449 RepID=A0A553K0J0_9ACTN|nr:ABC transporter permease [Tessaracoccus rhinocerotis]TRY18220.1 ABC transporter permease [Tessaracoccus rhinocerotis]